jgi:hypothetical protein
MNSPLNFKIDLILEVLQKTNYKNKFAKFAKFALYKTK